jgi:hypothetical protein
MSALVVMATWVDGPACMTVRTVAAVAAEAVAPAVRTLVRAATAMWALGMEAAVLGTAALTVGTAMRMAQVPLISRFVGMSPASWRPSF